MATDEPTGGASPRHGASGAEASSAAKRSKLYTRTGDDGTTGLFSDRRVRKDDARIEAYGAVDELNSCVGWARAETAARMAGADGGGRVDVTTLTAIDRLLEVLQHRLFEVGADLATPPGSRFEDRVTRIGDADVRDAERWIDDADSGNAPLRTFVLPGGSELAARLHLARTQCRRAERAVVTLAQAEPVGEALVRFLNRASDLLFALARRANLALGAPDVPWVPRSKAP